MVNTLPTSTEQARRENFPVENFRYLEAKLQAVRNKVMQVAVGRAAMRDQREDIYTVTREDVANALNEVLNDPASLRSLLGLDSAEP